MLLKISLPDISICPTYHVPSWGKQSELQAGKRSADFPRRKKKPMMLFFKLESLSLGLV